MMSKEEIIIKLLLSSIPVYMVFSSLNKIKNIHIFVCLFNLYLLSWLLMDNQTNFVIEESIYTPDFAFLHFVFYFTMCELIKKYDGRTLPFLELSIYKKSLFIDYVFAIIYLIIFIGALYYVDFITLTR
jgi:hypothetical protein